MVVVDTIGQLYFLNYTSKTTLYGPYAPCGASLPSSVIFPPSVTFAIAACLNVPYKVVSIDMANKPIIKILASLTYIPGEIKYHPTHNKYIVL